MSVELEDQHGSLPLRDSSIVCWQSCRPAIRSGFPSHSTSHDYILFENNRNQPQTNINRKRNLLAHETRGRIGQSSVKKGRALGTTGMRDSNLVRSL